MRAMKDSGIEWIGEIPREWDVVRIKYVLDKSEFGIKIGPFGSTLANRTLSSGEYSVYSQANLIANDFSETNHYIDKETFEDLRTYEVKPGDVCVSMMGTIGKCKEVPCGIREGIMDSHLIKIRLNVSRINPRFFEYVYDKDDSGVCYTQMQYEKKGTIMDGLNTTIVKNLFLTLPPLLVQERIANYLDAKCAKIDALIAAKEKTNALLKERRQSIIYEAVTKGLDPTTPMKDSGVDWIGEIPQGWKVCRIKHLVDKSHPYPVGDGDHGMIKADDYQGEGIPYIRVLNLSWGMGMDLDNLVYISEEVNGRIKNSELRPNDILIAKTGATIGKTAIVPQSMPLSNTTSHVGKITISSEYDAKYFFYVMTSFVVQKQIVDLSSMQSTRPELGIDGLKNLIVTFPPLEDQQRISQYLDCRCVDIDSMINSIEKTIKALKEYRQSLIYEVVTGKLEIQD